MLSRSLFCHWGVELLLTCRMGVHLFLLLRDLIHILLSGSVLRVSCTLLFTGALLLHLLLAQIEVIDEVVVLPPLLHGYCLSRSGRGLRLEFAIQCRVLQDLLRVLLLTLVDQ